MNNKESDSDFSDDEFYKEIKAMQMSKLVMRKCFQEDQLKNVDWLIYDNPM